MKYKPSDILSEGSKSTFSTFRTLDLKIGLENLNLSIYPKKTQQNHYVANIFFLSAENSSDERTLHGHLRIEILIEFSIRK